VEEDEEPDVIMEDNVDIPRVSEEELKKMASDIPIRPQER
jgi:hypothetical protein